MEEVWDKKRNRTGESYAYDSCVLMWNEERKLLFEKARNLFQATEQAEWIT